MWAKILEVTDERIVDLKSCSYVPITVDDRIMDVLVTVGFKCFCCRLQP
ncbi:hypothetical protein NC653_030748 [Populus alba x Populus x berolinensis]|uniref:Uncharacterized protein n=1 Tax=Populus alba x Populus x berolinensis TaxID=444605 RepID=A0AAD6LWR9_9ROSI|nr:hypothetical protein NC653_030748 [Populus alba x Populus x berolinensis]